MLTPDDIERMIAEASATGNDALVQSLQALASLPPDQQAEALQQLSQDYEGREKTLRDELETNYGLLTQQSPQGQVAGNNQFSVYVGASPLEHLASGIQKYQAGKGIKQNKADLEQLSADKEAGLSAVQRAMIQGMQADALRNGRPETPEEKRRREEEERYYRLYGPRSSVGA